MLTTPRIAIIKQQEFSDYFVQQPVPSLGVDESGRPPWAQHFGGCCHCQALPAPAGGGSEGLTGLSSPKERAAACIRLSCAWAAAVGGGTGTLGYPALARSTAAVPAACRQVSFF